MKWACYMLVWALLLTSSIPSPCADARRSLPSASQTLPLPGSKKWYPISRAIFGWSRLANREREAEERHPVDRLVEREEAEERHPADKLLRRRKADMTESYILGGY